MGDLYKTNGIVLHSIAHGDKGFITYLYTRDFGRVNYYIYGSRKNIATVGGVKISLQPLNLIAIVGQMPQRGDLHRLKEAKTLYLPSHNGDLLKSTIILYMAEFI